MKSFRNALASVALGALVLAQPAAAADAARTASPVGEAEGIGGTELALGLFFVVLIALEIAGAIEVTDLLGDEEPASP